MHVLTGPVHSGKTTCLQKTCALLSGRGIGLGGYLSEAVFENGVQAGYDLVSLKNGVKNAFIRKEGEPGWMKTGSFFFIPAGIEMAAKIILQGAKSDVLVVDEAGPLELEGKGVWPALSRAISQGSAELLLVIRTRKLEEFLRIPLLSRAEIFNIEEKDACERLAESVLDTLGTC